MAGVEISSGDLPKVARQKLSGGTADLERERQARSVRQSDLASAAGVSLRTYARHVQSGRNDPKLTVRLWRALARLAVSPGGDHLEAELIRATHRGFVAVLASDWGVTAAMVEAADPRLGATADATWRACAHVRQAALYLTNTTLGLKQKRLADVMGLTPAAVCLALKAVEDRRDDPTIDAALTRAARTITGRDE